MLAACRDRGAVVGAAMLLTGFFVSDNAWGHPHLTAARASYGNGELRRLSLRIVRLRRWLFSRRFASSFPSARSLFNQKTMEKQFSLSSGTFDIETFDRAFNHGFLALVAPLHANGDFHVAKASALNEAATYRLTRKTGVQAWLPAAPEAIHGFLLSALQLDRPERIIEMFATGTHPPMDPARRRQHVMGFLHDSIIEDNAQKVIERQGYRPSLIVVQPQELECLLQATHEQGVIQTQADKLLAVTAIARRKLNVMFAGIATKDGFGIGDAVLLGLTKPMGRLEATPTCPDLPSDNDLQKEARTACLMGRLIKRQGRGELAKVKFWDALETAHPGYILQNDELDDRAKADKLIIAGARRWYLVDQLAKDFAGQLHPDAIEAFRVILEVGYGRSTARELLGPHPLQRVEAAKDALVRFNKDHSDWLEAALDRYLERLDRFDRHLNKLSHLGSHLLQLPGQEQQLPPDQGQWPPTQF